ncbi:DUF7507 domain-containing protein, partial [Gilvibacter sediminis]|uniref:DUF7507 domain-containing protein n=1 Tax=Gilvibacter sediminis TaxID=379071 RepID=UPI002350DE14
GTDTDGNPIPDPETVETENGDGTTNGDPTDDPTVTTIQQDSSMSVIKNQTSAAGGEGDVITYDIVVTNTGNTTLTNIEITDDNAVITGGNPIAVLLPGESATVTAEHVITQDDIDLGYVENIATALGDSPDGPDTVGDTADTGTDTDGNPIPDPETVETENGDGTTNGDPTDDPTVTTIEQNSSMSVIKNQTSAAGGEGDVITYDIVVTNTGNTTLTNIEITDDNAVITGGNPIAVLLPGESATVTAEHVITQDDIDLGYVENIATALGDSPDGPDTVGDTADTGTDTDGNPIPDPETVETENGDGTTNGDPTDDPTVTTIEQNSSMSVIKNQTSAAGGEGDVITYDIVVTNTGNTTLTNIEITDDNAVITGGNPIAVLLPGESATVTAEHVITQDDIDLGYVENIATALGDSPDGPDTVGDTADTGTDTDGNPIPDPETVETENGDGTTNGDPTDDPTVTTIEQNSSMSVIKNQTSAAGGEGDVITYDIVVTNTGNTTLTNIEITDDNAVITGGNPIAVLLPGESATVTAEHVITQDDIDLGYVENIATALGDSPDGPDTVGDTADTGTDTDGNPIPDPETVETENGDGTTNGDPTDDPTVTILPQDGSIAIVKSGVFVDANANGCADEGETITYTFTVTNTGNVTLNSVVVNDPLLGGVVAGPLSGDTDGDGLLDVGEVWVYEATYTVTQDDIDAGNVTNQATVEALDPQDNVVNDESGTAIDTDDSTVTELCQNPAIAIVKTGIFVDGDGDDCADAGETIEYTFTVTNEGNVSLSGITVTDALVAPITFVDGDTDADGELDVDETWTYTGTYTITAGDIDAGEVVNTATAEGTAPDGTVVSDESGATVSDDDPTVTELCQNPAIAIVKTGIFVDGDGDDCADAGETIEYTFTVTNEGNVSLSGITVTDILVAPITFVDGDTDADGELDVDETWTYTGTYTITAGDIDAGEVVNTATAEGTAPDGTVVSDESGATVSDDDPTVTELCQNPAIAIVKTGIFVDGDGDDCADAGETIEYTFTVTNEGNVSLSGITVTDILVAPITFVDGDTDADGELDVDETWTYTGTYTITAGDIDAGEVVNTATAEGTAPDGTVVSDESGATVSDDDPTVTELCQNPAIAIVKTGIFVDGDGDDCADAGETIEYTFTVTNEGNVSLSGITVTDILVAPITFVDGDTDADGELDVDETWTYTGTYTITAGDIDAGEVVNTATAEGTAPDGTVVTDESGATVSDDDPTVTELCQNPAIAIVKTGIFVDGDGDDCADAGETIEYTFTVTNEGNVSLSGITVTDILVAPITFVDGDTDGDGELDVDETWTYTGTYTITAGDIDAGEVVNTATAEGTAPDGTVVSDESGATVSDDDPTVTELCQAPSIAIIKEGVFNDLDGDGCADVKETITYTFTVVNTGNVTLTNINVIDPDVAVIGGPLASLAAGDSDSTTFTATYLITQADIDAGFKENQAEVTGVTPTGGTVTDLSDDNSILEDDITVTDLCQAPSIALIKIGTVNDENGDGCTDAGETITYQFFVTNTGNVTLTDVTVIDPMVAVVGGPITLEVGATDTETFTAVYTVTLDDVNNGFVMNQAEAFGTAPDGTEVSDLSDNDSILEDDPTETNICQDGSISVEKIGVFNDDNGDGQPQAGETITYTFIVTNTGNVTVFDITIDDPLVPVTGGPITLEPGEVDDSTFTATYAITEDDIEAGEVINQAIASGMDQNGNEVSDESDDPFDTTNRDNNGDGDPDDPTVVVLPDVLGAQFEIFNGVTPDGDGLNDFFRINGIEDFPNNNMQIFNRWGVLVFETDNYGGADGQTNVFRGISEGRVTVREGQKLPTGTYYYVLRRFVEGETLTNAGYLYVNNK